MISNLISFCDELKIPNNYIAEESSVENVSEKKQTGRSALSSMTREIISQAVIKKYKDQYPRLSHVRVSSNTKGYIYTENGKVKAMINTETKSDGKIWIQGLEIFGDAKGKGLSYGLLDIAVKDLNAKYLSVNKSNSVAKHLYDEYGFSKYDEDDNMYYMKTN
jgi:ribosomal protein S18 acetylase RimI-like enzyme